MGSGSDEKKRPWKQRLAHEFILYWINVAYLAVFFGVFEWYRRLILAEHGIDYVDYGAAIIEAMVLGKLILIGDAIGLNRGFKKRPLIYPTLYRAVVFSIFVGLFAIIEHIFKGFLRNEGVTESLARVVREDQNEIFARCLVTFFAFIPFFSFRELARSLGEGKLRNLFFRKDSMASGT